CPDRLPLSHTAEAVVFAEAADRRSRNRQRQAAFGVGEGNGWSESPRIRKRVRRRRRGADLLGLGCRLLRRRDFFLERGDQCLECRGALGELGGPLSFLLQPGLGSLALAPLRGNQQLDARALLLKARGVGCQPVTFSGD